MKMPLSEIMLAATLTLLFLLFHVEVTGAEQANNSLKVYDEIRISPPDTNCDYYKEDYKRLYFNFDYPKLIIVDDKNPIVAFVDTKSKRLIFREISGQGLKTILNIPSFYERNLFDKWPIIFIHKDKIYIAAMFETQSNKERQYHIKIFLFERNNNKLTLQNDKLLTERELPDDKSKSQVYLSGIYPYNKDKKFIIVGGFNESHFHPLALFSGDFPSFTKSFSLIWEDSEIDKYRTIEQKGWFGAHQRSYALSDTDQVYGVWVRDSSRVGLSNKHNETICYSVNKNGTAWSIPLELYLVKKTELSNHIRNLSLSSFDNSAFLLWQDVEEGFYFEEIKDGIQHGIIKLDEAKVTNEIAEYLWGASTAKLTVDQQGNVYALWVRNFRSQYQIFLKSRANNKWTQTIILNSGTGIVKLPDMQVDKKGTIHITYIKKTSEKNVACYYIKLVKKEKSGRIGVRKNRGQALTEDR